LIEEQGVNAVVDDCYERAFREFLDDMPQFYREHQESTAMAASSPDCNSSSANLFLGGSIQTAVQPGPANIIAPTPTPRDFNTPPSAQELSEMRGFNQSRIPQPPDSGYGSIQLTEQTGKATTQPRGEDRDCQPWHTFNGPIFDPLESNAFGNVSHQSYSHWTAADALPSSYLSDEYQAVPHLMPGNQPFRDLEASADILHVESTFPQLSEDASMELEETLQYSTQADESSYFQS
jgi:hypothetical protein